MSLFHRAAACLLAIVCAAQSPLADRAAAHHTYVSKYDPDRIVSLKGTIASVDYRNPHIFFDITVINRDGSTTTWHVETEAIAKAQAKGLSESKLQVGTAVVATGWMSRTGEAEIGLKSISIGAKTYTIRNTAR
ncbi:MAG: hypothetical protein KJ587_04990 [Alphaproteobacteria bacterium]|nr:hypothetical protein [Alphaproteobacteria bacterium]